MAIVNKNVLLRVPGQRVRVVFAGEEIADDLAYLVPHALDAPTQAVGTEAPDGPFEGAPKGNASRDVWAAHAVSAGVEVTDDMTRNDIRAAVAAARA